MLGYVFLELFPNDILIEKYKNFLPFFNKDDLIKITIILKNGIPSNENGPAIFVETKNEIIKSYMLNGFYHRLYGPAIEYKFNKNKNKWIVDGFLINYNGLKNWSIDNNISLDYNEWSFSDKIKFLKKWRK